MTDKPSTELLAGILGRQLMISQVAVVVTRSREDDGAVHEAPGLGPVERLPPRAAAPARHRRARRSVDYTMLGAETHVGDVGFELLQPLTGPSIYREWIEEHGEGLHHVAVMLHDFDESTELKRRFDEVGAPVLMGGRIGETIEFYYLDTEPSLKIILESGSGHAIDLVPDYTYP